MTSVKINLEKNIQLCFDSGFDTLIAAGNDGNYRNAIVSIHNGLELLMKYYLINKEKLLIFKKIDHHFLLYERKDLMKKTNSMKTNTISFIECMERLEFFSEIPKNYLKYLTHLNDQRNDCVHYKYSYNEKEIRKLLISHIYQCICDLIFEMGLNIEDFLSEEHKLNLDQFKKYIDDEIKQSYLVKIRLAKKHYFIELTEEERKQKADNEDYTKMNQIDKVIKCPACEKNALLRKKIQLISENFGYYEVIKKNLILKDLTCHHCALSITDYDQLKLNFEDEERSLNEKSVLIYEGPDDYPDERVDCPDYDCPDDCPDFDCPDDCPN